jgi:hypothetical protein
MEKLTDKINVEDGEYNANWGGWVLNIDGKEFTTLWGIRTSNLPIKCKVIEGEAYIIYERK